MGRTAGRRPKRRAYGKWSAELREGFLTLLRATGNARAALRVTGHPNMFYKRRRRDPEFAREWAEAVAAADAALKGATSPFPRILRPGSGQAAEGAVPLAIVKLPTDADSLGGYLRPGRKRKPSRPEPVIRRAANGRLQLRLALEGEWTSEIEADFLARLRATGNFAASARAVGFPPSGVHERARKWAGFARECDEAIDEASAALDYRLVAHAHALLRAPGEPSPEGEPELPFDPEAAMRILGFIDMRRHGRSGRGRRKGPPERSFQEAIDSILAKIEAIERHEKMMKANGEADGDSPQDADGDSPQDADGDSPQ